MSSDYNIDRSEEASSITGQDIHVKGLSITEEEWHDKEDFADVTKEELRQIGWMNVESGDIVALIDSDWDNAAVEPNQLSEDSDPADVELITKKPYRIIGFQMSDSEEPFVFVIFLHGPDELHMVIFGGDSSEQDTGVWKAESNEKIFDEPPGCGILSDRTIAQLFDYEPDMISHRI